jgi:hypothetical protein
VMGCATLALWVLTRALRARAATQHSAADS